ncbi:protein PAT1 homolog 1 [Euwallacea similis]|uniref:protein PAT1 homolog 1 n=1 Tax=Euwallacea similis TaxID=1736056 RepID=UPI00344B4303
MANSFFDFDTSLKGDLDPKNGEPLLPEDDDGFENEEEYDALNDETFGACVNDDDWEKQHEQFAINESSKHSDSLDVSLSRLGLEDLSDDDDDDDESPTELTFPKDSSVWTYNPPQKNGDVFNNSVLSSLQKASKSFIETQTAQNPVLSYLNSHAKGSSGNSVPPMNFQLQPGKICTVEELEKNLIKSSQQQKLPVDLKGIDLHSQQQNHVPLNQINLQHAQGQQRPLLSMPPHGVHPYHPMLQHPGARLPPPGLPPLNLPPPNMRHLPPMNHPMMHPGFRMMPPHHHMMHPNGPPGYPYPLPVNHPFNYPPPPPHGIVGQQIMGPSRPHPMQQQQYSPQKQQQQQYQLNLGQRVRHDSGSSRYSNRDQHEQLNRDEYAGLMTPKDKQWLLNIQMIQLNTGTPYFDDYYYTIYKERKSKSNKENIHNNDRNNKFQRQRRNSERQENNLTPRVYTPLQFENSLGKLQCGSVTAPRKIIDMDVVQPDKEQELPPPSRDSKKTKQYLLELEALYSLLLKAEDINNPLYLSNMEKLREMKQKQRLRELEQATTPEQKQEVLRLFKLESEPVVENELDYINRILSGFVQEDKFSSFLNIRKGKMLLLRLLPYLSLENFGTQLLDIWSKVLLSLPLTGRRDTAGDTLLPKLYPHFKKFVQTCTMSDIIDMITGLVEEVKQENNRSTPLSHAGKAPLYFVVLNRFGVSAMVCLFLRAETIFSTVDPTEKQHNDWTNFLISWAKHAESVSKVPVPLEGISSEIFRKHADRFKLLTVDKKATLEKYFVDVHHIH